MPTFPGRRTAFAGNEARSVIHDWIRSGLRGRYRHAWPEGDLDAELRTRTHPLLAIHLRDDRFAPPSSFNALVARLSNAKTQRHHLVPTDFESAVATHFSWMKDPAPIAARIREFIVEQRVTLANAPADPMMSRRLIPPRRGRIDDCTDPPVMKQNRINQVDVGEESIDT